MGGGGGGVVARTGDASPLALCPTRRVSVGVLRDGRKDCYSLVLSSETAAHKRAGMVRHESTRWAVVQKA